MKITIENTNQMVELADDRNRATFPARVWNGVTESGIQVQVLVTRIAVSKADDNSQFEKELTETPAPCPTLPHIFPARLIL